MSLLEIVGTHSRRGRAGLDAGALLVGRRAGGAGAGCGARRSAVFARALRRRLPGHARHARRLLPDVPARPGGAANSGRWASGSRSGLPRRVSVTGLSWRRSRRGSARWSICRGWPLLDRGSAVLPVARRGELAGRAASRAEGSVRRHRVLAGPDGAACRAGAALAAGHAARILPGGSAGGDRLCPSRDSDAGGSADGAAGRTDRIHPAARTGAHTASRLSGQPVADRGGRPGVLSPGGVVDFRGDSRRARELL